MPLAVVVTPTSVRQRGWAWPVTVNPEENQGCLTNSLLKKIKSSKMFFFFHSQSKPANSFGEKSESPMDAQKTTLFFIWPNDTPIHTYSLIVYLFHITVNSERCFIIIGYNALLQTAMYTEI